MILQRRQFLIGLSATLAAPAIVPFASLMRVRKLELPPAIIPSVFWNGDGVTAEIEYDWFDSNGKLMGTGPTLTLTKEISKGIINVYGRARNAPISKSIIRIPRLEWNG